MCWCFLQIFTVDDSIVNTWKIQEKSLFHVWIEWHIFMPYLFVLDWFDCKFEWLYGNNNDNELNK